VQFFLLFFNLNNSAIYVSEWNEGKLLFYDNFLSPLKMRETRKFFFIINFSIYKIYEFSLTET
jgi:hypothetical protein